MKSKIEAGNDTDPAGNDSCVLDTGAKSGIKDSDFMLIAENNAALCNSSAVSEVLHERNGSDVHAENQHFDIIAPLPAAHHITTRSVTGRLAKRPRKDLSPARSPPRKLGTYMLCQIWIL